MTRSGFHGGWCYQPRRHLGGHSNANSSIYSERGSLRRVVDPRDAWFTRATPTFGKRRACERIGAKYDSCRTLRGRNRWERIRPRSVRRRFFHSLGACPILGSNSPERSSSAADEPSVGARMHTLPKGFPRPRYFGRYHGRKRKDYLNRCREYLTIVSPQPIKLPERTQPTLLKCQRCDIERGRLVALTNHFVVTTTSLLKRRLAHSNLRSSPRC
jgi:hypothetical protein